jgi:hypothetical protein
MSQYMAMPVFDPSLIQNTPQICTRPRNARTSLLLLSRVGDSCRHILKPVVENICMKTLGKNNVAQLIQTGTAHATVRL